MTDMRLLLARLRDYEKALGSHNARVEASWEHLKGSLRRLSHYYDGTGATDFKAHFARTEAGLNQYLEGTQAIKLLLEDRIEHLAAADRAGDLR